MPHLQIQYSKNLAEDLDLQNFCTLMAAEISAIGFYPIGGIRVRAAASDYFAIADMHPNNNFLDMIFRIGSGRSDAEKKATGERLMAAAEQFFTREIDGGFFMLSLEIIEISKEYSWKTNSVHQRLKRKVENVS